LGTLRRLSLIAALVALALLAATFASSNPRPIDVDIGFMRFERVSMAAAFAVVLALGWVLGWLSAFLALWRSASEKRRLRHDLQHAEAELDTQRKSP
jgi:uncharacterized membrane protein YciS (DUF1049 family)